MPRVLSRPHDAPPARAGLPVVPSCSSSLPAGAARGMAVDGPYAESKEMAGARWQPPAPAPEAGDTRTARPLARC